MKNYELVELSNGIRVVFKPQTHTKVAHVGVMLDIGSRDEESQHQGIAHFWEHMAFKGTKKRNAFHIINRLDSLGGELNAYTTKEKICFYASVLDVHLEKAIDILTDITFNSTFPKKQVEKERGVIFEEIQMYKDSPEDTIQDEFDELVFGAHPLGKNILGTEDILMNIHQSDFNEFIHKNLNTERIVFSIVGNFGLNKINRLVRKYIDPITHKNHTSERIQFDNYQFKNLTVEKPYTQAHCAIGNIAYPIGDPRRIPLFLLVNILGGPGMNSKLNMSLREKYGYVYSIDASYSAYLETGIVSILFGTDIKKLNKAHKVVLKEIKTLKNKPLSNLKLHQAKSQLKGQLAISEENYSSVMQSMAKNLLDMNDIESLDSLFKKIDKIDKNILMEIAADIFDDYKISCLTFIPN